MPGIHIGLRTITLGMHSDTEILDYIYHGGHWQICCTKVSSLVQLQGVFCLHHYAITVNVTITVELQIMCNKNVLNKLCILHVGRDDMQKVNALAN